MNPNGRMHFRACLQAVVGAVAQAPVIAIARTARAAIPGLLGVALAAFAASPSGAERWPNRILYFTHSAGFRHDVIPTSRAVLKQLGEASRAFRITATEDVSALTAENLRHYAAVMFFTTGELPMSDAQKARFSPSSGPAAAFSASIRPPTRSTCGRSTESSSADTSTSIPGISR